MSFELDAYDRKILALLQDDARLGYSEIGRRIHLTAPAVTERVRRLQEAGVIEGFTARLNLRALGYSFEAFVNVTVESHDALDAWAAAHPEVLALHTTTGSHCALIRLAVTAPEHLQALIKSLGEIGKTTTSIVLSSQFEDRPRLAGAQLPLAASKTR
ncbi:Lrp/AsnC family transcriptional regulator, leucine-responsive regulatory protein [Janthinobacterium sp. CG_23.3]|uniref:Lrp/AsnC family transcriptional regulator n=1 Tax=unclassified Janthinobacterium TaxID=2610881 RepID=UPI00034B82F7|nr:MULTISPECIES: Lrp/AsnC family transcriptional regulator [unclassified Janthinobacterium]MEC5162771.1 Lrp/AsnC family leucine-responsive transcriptional regulator [Janthinobacterium sp. CG_S6]